MMAPHFACCPNKNQTIFWANSFLALFLYFFATDIRMNRWEYFSWLTEFDWVNQGMDGNTGNEYINVMNYVDTSSICTAIKKDKHKRKMFVVESCDAMYVSVFVRFWFPFPFIPLSFSCCFAYLFHINIDFTVAFRPAFNLWSLYNRNRKNTPSLLCFHLEIFAIQTHKSRRYSLEKRI